MYTVYVLKSKRNGKRYVGSTGKSAESRLKEHNQGSNMWTKTNGPFDLVYQENFTDKTESIKREIFLKSGQGRKLLDKIFIPG